MASLLPLWMTSPSLLTIFLITGGWIPGPGSWSHVIYWQQCRGSWGRGSAHSGLWAAQGLLWISNSLHQQHWKVKRRSHCDQDEFSVVRQLPGVTLCPFLIGGNVLVYHTNALSSFNLVILWLSFSVVLCKWFVFACACTCTLGAVIDLWEFFFVHLSELRFSKLEVIYQPLGQLFWSLHSPSSSCE